MQKKMKISLFQGSVVVTVFTLGAWLFFSVFLMRRAVFSSD